MAKSSSLVIGFFFVMLVVLQSAYVSGTGPAASPGDYCDAKWLYIGTFPSCEMCQAACPSPNSSTCISPVNTGIHTCCCARTSVPAAATKPTITSLSFFSFSLFLSFMFNMLFS
ncbi:hypothetical protein MKX01_031160 [Papaver californicum]|nr:hypothetical protein MKX01_031160 [Papaver californicum]